MKKNNLFLCLSFLLITLLSCSRKPEQPAITLSEYSKQAITSKGVVEKLLNESDYKKMHEIALAIESSRAVECKTVSDECNILGQILNKIVKSTNDGLPGEADNVAIYKLVNQLDEEFNKGHEKLASQWKEYINSNASEQNSK
jgi:membrane-associated HD superfamily phosphohydrolase